MRYRIEFDIEVPSFIAYEDVLEWARFQCHDNSEMKNANPLADTDIEPIFTTFEVIEGAGGGRV